MEARSARPLHQLIKNLEKGARVYGQSVVLKTPEGRTLVSQECFDDNADG